MENATQRAAPAVPVALPPGTEELVKDSNSTLQLASLMNVEDQESYETSCEAIIEWKDKVKEREAFFKPAKQAIDNAKKIILDWEKAAVQPLQRAIDLVSQKALTWKRAEEERAAAERRRLEEEARKKEEEARIAEAERLRKHAEEEAKKLPPAQAEEVKKQGEEAAQMVLDTPIETPRLPVQPAVQQPIGLNTRKTWDFEIVDTGQINRIYMKADEVKIRKQVLALGKEAEQLVGGIRVFVKEGFTRRA